MTYVLDGKIPAALAKALDVLGEESRQVIFYQIARRGVNLANVTAAEVVDVLYAMLGPAASIIAVQMKQELGKLSCDA